MKKEVLAPWNLKGVGYILLFKFDEDFIKKEIQEIQGFDLELVDKTGFVMMVDYEESNVGPYKELLLIPGKFRYKEKKFYTISKIYVSSEASVFNGRKNWGIPKELADFNFTKNKSDRIEVSKNNELIIDLSIKSFGPHIPFSTKIMPLPIIQMLDDKIFLTDLKAKGRAQMGKLDDVKSNTNMFPDIARFNPHFVVKVEDFSMIFPDPIVIE